MHISTLHSLATAQAVISPVGIDLAAARLQLIFAQLINDIKSASRGVETQK